MGDSYFNRFKVTSKVLSKMELSKACEFVELQMLLPRRYCVDTQVRSYTAAICCESFATIPTRSDPCHFQSLPPETLRSSFFPSI